MGLAELVERWRFPSTADDLTWVLLILADLCEGHGMARAATEARYFHALAAGKWRE